MGIFVGGIEGFVGDTEGVFDGDNDGISVGDSDGTLVGGFVVEVG